MTTRNRLRMQTSQLAGAIRTPQGALRAILLLGLLALWFAVGVWTFSTPIVDSVSQYDLVVIHAAGREALAGGDPYSQEFIASLHADPHGTGYAYPLASLWVLLPFLPFPIAWAATLWVSVSICALVALAPLLGDTRLNWIWLAPLLFYPSLYALKIVQWAPLQIGLLGLSLWLFRRDQPLLSGILAPLVTVKPTTGIGLALLAALLCGSNKRWWQGAMLGGVFWYGTPLLLQPDWPWRWLHTLQTYADPAARQFLLTLTDLPDGKLCAAATLLIACWSLWQRRVVSLGCALLVLATLATPHRAQYDYPVLCLPLLFLPRRFSWLIGVAVILSWLFPLTFELGWSSSLQLTLFLFAPAILACALVDETSWRAPAIGVPAAPQPVE
ncbi:MAG TPA: glycosyltransferase 87 family protein [Roseiflexaceae bacterium]|nr:glycosyltransferase 87 family protein [Roseiflexaceae bacterium]